MRKAIRYLAQAALYALFFVPLAYFSRAPIYSNLEEGMAVLKVAVRHPGVIVGECTSAAASGHGMRPSTMTESIEVCPRERSPLKLKLTLDGKVLYDATVPPSGLHGDGISSMYQRFEIPVGPHHLQIKMNDDVKIEGYTWQLEQDISLKSAQVLVASFKEGFKIQ
jgi:hypothetical protein